MELYCSPCDTAVCKECTKGEHAEHAAVPLRDAVEQHRVRLQDQLETTKKRLPEINSAMRSLTEFQQQLSSQKASIEEDIHSTFEDLQKTLNVRKSVLLMELEVTYGLKQKVLQSQLDTLLQGQEEIHDCCSVTEQGLSCSSEAEVLLLKKQMSERLAELASHQYPLQPQENDQLDFLVETEGLKKSVHNLGTIVTTSAVAYETEASGEGLRQCVVGHPTSVIITTKDKDGEPCKTGSASVTAEIFTPDGSVADGEILDNKNGTYEFLYTVPKEGSFTLSLRLYDQHIKGSPFKLKVTKSADVSPSTDGAKKRVKSPGSGHVKQRLAKRPASMFSTSKRKENPIEDDMIFRVGRCWASLLSTKGRNKGEFTNLQGVAASSDGNILIADSNNQCVQPKGINSNRTIAVRMCPRVHVQIFSNDGQFINRFGVRGRSPGQLQRPTGVAVHPNGDIIIADYDNKWVSIFSNDGKFKSKIGAGKLMGPKGVSVDKNGNLIVVDNKACSVLIFQLSGKLLTRFGSRGNGDKQFAGPHFAAVNNDNEIIITDFHNHSVKVFNSEGEFLLKFGSNGEGNGQFNAPTGVAVDASGNIIVADWGNSRIQVFDGSGSFLSYINTSVEPLYGPQGLALTSDGHVVVADSGNHCFKVYRYLQ
ncbi:tripartite motif-containing protein 2-like [Scleropages formosus]|uniref:RING-type E3 ubiquitin transferase n=1 Tax=Scleropages formosus TaxID=113540 RepID=A0A0P7UMX6_SCLFO|nr:tripartite motif-containing protein 2-like [Scleropages formosus]